MNLSAEQKKKVIEFIEKTWPPNAACPICRHSDWAIKNRIYRVSSYAEGEDRQMSLPLVVVNCEHCGNTLFLNAARLGITCITGTKPGNLSSETGTSGG